MVEKYSANQKILVFNDLTTVSKIIEEISRQLPLIEFISVSTINEFRQKLATTDFDIVIIEFLLPEINGLDLLIETKLQDSEPAILMTLSSDSEELINKVYEAGCHRCIVKTGYWLNELVAAIRNLLRIRRLEQENARLIAKLTEANSLLSEKNNRLTEFSSTVAHDIRGPLAGINMKLEYMCENYQEHVDDRLKKLLKSSFSASERLLSIVNSMYEFAKLGAQATKMEMLDLSQLVKTVISDLNYQDNLNVSISVEEMPMVWGNAPLLSKVFINLITNAVKYSDKLQTIIKIGLKKTQKRSIARFAEFVLEDNGAGISQEELKDLFVMFRRGKDADQKCDGTGIGLSVVKHIIELHYGEISVESKQCYGTRFTFSLPLEPINLVVTVSPSF